MVEIFDLGSGRHVVEIELDRTQRRLVEHFERGRGSAHEAGHEGERLWPTLRIEAGRIDGLDGG
jgi:hypothetical protein